MVQVLRGSQPIDLATSLSHLQVGFCHEFIGKIFLAETLEANHASRPTSFLARHHDEVICPSPER